MSGMMDWNGPEHRAAMMAARAYAGDAPVRGALSALDAAVGFYERRARMAPDGHAGGDFQALRAARAVVAALVGGTADPDDVRAWAACAPGRVLTACDVESSSALRAQPGSIRGQTAADWRRVCLCVRLPGVLNGPPAAPVKAARRVSSPKKTSPRRAAHAVG